LRPRFQADADLNETIVLATVRQEPAVDFQTATSGGLRGLPHPAVLALAASLGRILVTHDFRTMPRHFADFITESSSAGVLLVPQHLPIAAAVEQILLVWAASEASEWTNRLVVLPL
jgi:Domain of unknown function (DUF5615)